MNTKEDHIKKTVNQLKSGAKNAPNIIQLNGTCLKGINLSLITGCNYKPEKVAEELNKFFSRLKLRNVGCIVSADYPSLELIKIIINGNSCFLRRRPIECA